MVQELHVLLAILSVLFVATARASSPNAAINRTQLLQLIASLQADVYSAQWNDSMPYVFPIGFGHDQGRFQNNIHINLNGPPPMTKARRDVATPDNNMFVTTFVMDSLYTVDDLFFSSPSAVSPGPVQPLSDGSMASALQSCLSNHDHYHPSSAPIFGFWPQKLIATMEGFVWKQWSINLAGPARDGKFVIDVLRIMFDMIGLGPLYNKIVGQLETLFDKMLFRFSIPADADDTSTLLALTRQVYLQRQRSPWAWATWSDSGFDINEAFSIYGKYAYCPASSDPLANSIDPRSYFWARPFLNSLSDPEACVVTTWFESFDYIAGIWNGTLTGPLIPFNVNNIDPTVGANSLYAMSSMLLLNHSAWFNGTARKLYVTTAKFVAWALSNQPTQQRADLEMLYYPPVVNLVYFVARHVHMLNSYVVAGNPLPFSEMIEARNLLTKALRIGGMQWLQGNAHNNCDSPNGPSAKEACWEGFLGQGDKNANNQSTPHADDRFFTTAVALNALLDTWSVRTPNASHAFSWMQTTPAEAKLLAAGAVRYLFRAAQNESTVYENGFFSGSVKGFADLPFFVPPNTIINMSNGETFTCATYNSSDIGDATYFAVRGQMSDAAFNAVLRNGCAGNPMITNFTGYNDPKAAFPYWSSVPLSKAFGMMALAKVANMNWHV